MRHLFSYCRILISASLLVICFGIDRAHAGLPSPATAQELYTEKAVIPDATDRTLSSYWSDKADKLDFERPPVIYTAHFTDADGRRLLVTTIHAVWPTCSIFGCPVRIQTEQGEKLLDRVSACDLVDEHHLSPDGRTFIACDEKFPIPGPGRLIEETSKPLPDYHLYGEQHDFDGPNDALFSAYWNDQADDIAHEPSPPAYRSIDVGHFVDADGRKLVVTMLHDPVQCGMQVCPVRIFTEDGKLLLDSIACNEATLHRISADRRHLIACRQAIEIPETPSAKASATADAASRPAAPRLPLEQISYDSGTDVESPKAWVFQAYWSDKAARINWKAPISERGKIYNWPLPSADGRNLVLTMLQSSTGNVCDPLCPARVFTAQHTKIMDILVCNDRSQHGVSVDHRSFVACGEIFPIPQVDKVTAIKENAPAGSDPDAYIEVVRRLNSRPANASKPVSVNTAFHNHSAMLVSEWKDGTVEITYDAPRQGLPVAQGTLLFRGVRDGVRYSGNRLHFQGRVLACRLPCDGNER